MFHLATSALHVMCTHTENVCYEKQTHQKQQTWRKGHVHQVTEIMTEMIKNHEQWWNKHESFDENLPTSLQKTSTPLKLWQNPRMRQSLQHDHVCETTHGMWMTIYLKTQISTCQCQYQRKEHGIWWLVVCMLLTCLLAWATIKKTELLPTLSKSTCSWQWTCWYGKGSQMS